MKGKYEIAWIDRVDEDRWISASIVSAIFLVFAYIILSIIEIPKYPERPKPIEEIKFVEEEVKKKVIQTKTKEQNVEVKKEIFDEEPEITINLFDDTPTEAADLPQNLDFSDKFQVFEEQSQDDEHLTAVTQIAEGMILPEDDIAAEDIPQGFESDWTQENVSTMIVTTPTGDNKIEENRGLSTTIQAENKTNRLDFKAYRGNLRWEDIIDPVIDWINKNESYIGQIPELKLKKGDESCKTAKVVIPFDGEIYDLLLVSKPSLRQITICLVNRKTNQYVLLVDQGSTRRSSMLEVGKATRGKNNEIVYFKGTRKKADDPIAKKHMEIFKAWAKTVK